MSAKQKVVFVCSSNCGKSQMAEALAVKHAGENLDINSGGTNPGKEINTESAEALAEIGADMSGGEPTGLDPELLRTADRIVILGSNAQLDLPEGSKATMERWLIDEPSDRGFEGMERMRMVRDDIDSRVQKLVSELKDD